MTPYLLVAGDFVETGGMDVANYHLAASLADAGREVHLVSHRVQKDLLERPNIVFHRVPKPANSYFLGEYLLAAEGRKWAAQVSNRGGRVIVNGGNCDWGDVNWVHYVHAVYKPQLATGRIKNWRAGFAYSQYRKRERKIISKARLVIANSERTKRDVIVHLGVPEERVATVYYGSDGEKFRPCEEAGRVEARTQLGLPPSTPLVLFVGALGDRRKGFHTLFAAWQQLCRDPRWDGVLVVVGSGGELDVWRGRALECGLGDRIQFLGFRRDVPAIMSVSDALVAPIIYEAYGLGAQEALACGLPVFVTSTAGVAEQYPAPLQDLLMNLYEDPESLAQRLRSWRMRMPSFRERVRPLSERLRSHSWQDMAQLVAAEIEAAA